jgi:hypothetical protein
MPQGGIAGAQLMSAGSVRRGERVRLKEVGGASVVVSS